MFTVESEVVTLVFTVNVPLVAPSAIVRFAGTVTTVVSLLERVIVAPPGGAGLWSVTVAVVVSPPATVVGLRDREDRCAGGPMTRLSKMCSLLLQLEFERIKIDPGGLATFSVAGPNEKTTGSGICPSL